MQDLVQDLASFPRKILARLHISCKTVFSGGVIACSISALDHFQCLVNEDFI